MNSIRNRLVVAVLLVLACATVAAGIHEQRQLTLPIAAAAAAPFPVGSTWRDPSVPDASTALQGNTDVRYEEAPTF